MIEKNIYDKITENMPGDVVISKDKVIKIKNEIDESGCRIIVSHQHEGIHTHFTCENRSYDDTLKIIKLLKEY